MAKFALSSLKLESALIVRERRNSFLYFLSKRSLKSFVSFLKRFSDILMRTGAYVAELTLIGVGFKFLSFNNRVLQLTLGYSHDLYIFMDKGVSYRVFKQYLALFSYDRLLSTQAAARIRSLRAPDSYKGKGVRYLNEVVSIKKGKQKQR